MTVALIKSRTQISVSCVMLEDFFTPEEITSLFPIKQFCISFWALTRLSNLVYTVHAVWILPSAVIRGIFSFPRNSFYIFALENFILASLLQ